MSPTQMIGCSGGELGLEQLFQPVKKAQFGQESGVFGASALGDVGIENPDAVKSCGDQPGFFIRLTITESASYFIGLLRADDGHTIESLLAAHIRLVAKLPQILHGKFRILALDLLEAEDVRPVALDPGKEHLLARANSIYIESGDFPIHGKSRTVEAIGFIERRPEGLIL